MTDKFIKEWKKTFPNEFLQTELITSTEGIRMKTPCIRNTRIPVSQVLHLLSLMGSVDAVIEDYPSLTREDVLAAAEYGAWHIEALANHIIGIDDFFEDVPLIPFKNGGDVS